MTWQCHMGWPDVVREYFPNVNNAQAWDILWMLGYPTFNALTDSDRVERCRDKLARMVGGNNQPMGCIR